MPEPVGMAIGHCSAALIAFAATRSTALPPGELDARVDRINAAADQVAKQCAG